MAIVLHVLNALIAASAVSLVLLFCFVKWRYRYWARRGIPSLPPRIPFGNLESPSKRTSSIGILVKNIYEEMKRKGCKHCGVYFLASPVYMVIDLDLLKNILVKEFEFFTDRGMYFNEKDDPISAHIFAIGGSKWKNLRSKLTPTFTSGKMKMMFPIMRECVEILLLQMEKNQNPIEIKEILGRFTTDIIGSCAFGLDCNSIKEDDSPFRIYGKKVFNSTKSRSFKMMFATNFPRLGRLFGIRQVSSDISEFFTKIVRETIDYRANNNVGRRDFLQMLMELLNEKILSFEEVVAQAFIFFLAGFETSSTTITFTLYELAKNPEIQEKLRREIGKFLGHEEITYDKIAEMQYLDRVVEESLRKYPPLPFVTRTCVKDYSIPGTGCVLEKGRRVLIPILGIHMDEEYYPEPENFDPDRFKDGKNQYSYIPFGEGPRICIGMRFGLMQVKVGLVALIRNYKFLVNSRTKDPLEMDKNSFILSAKGGIWLDKEKI